MTDSQKEMFSFHKKQVSQINCGQSRAKLYDAGKIVIHLIPEDSLEFGQKRSIVSETQIAAREPRRIKPMNSPFGNPQINADGVLLSHSPSSGSYLEVYRNGIIEVVDSRILWSSEEEKQRKIPQGFFEKQLRETVKEYLDFLRSAGITVPIYIFITLIDVEGYSILTNSFHIGHSHALLSSSLELPPRILEENVDDTLRPLYNIIWNACGMEKSENYNEQGLWMPGR